MAMGSFKNICLLIMFLVLIYYWLKTKSYAFEKKEIIKIGEQYAGEDVRVSIAKICDELHQLYPSLILPKDRLEWVMFKYSGMTLSTVILHASLSEIIAVTGSAVDTDGFIGRHWMNVTYAVLSGSLNYWQEGKVDVIEYNSAQSFTLSMYKHTGSFHWKANTWVLEYGRGFLPLSMPSMLFDGIFTSFDVIGTFKMLRAFGISYFYGIQNEIASYLRTL